ncbi:MAG: PP2C family serine/threonine-protein phosphatase [Saprospiraceae bacterium]
MTIYSFSHQGKKKTQEDAILSFQEQNIFAICDGVGGSSQGALASTFIIDFVKNYGQSFGNNIENLLIEASKGLEQLSINEGIWTEMATTVVIAKMIDDATIITSHLGDSKFMYFSYLDESKNFISKDHSLKEEFKSAGLVNQDNRSFPFKNMITKYISNHKLPNITDFDSTIISGIKPNDLFILCSDGALEHITPTDLGKLFFENILQIDKKWLYFDNLCKDLSKDNASCLMVKF